MHLDITKSARDTKRKSVLMMRQTNHEMLTIAMAGVSSAATSCPGVYHKKGGLKFEKNRIRKMLTILNKLILHVLNNT